MISQFHSPFNFNVLFLQAFFLMTTFAWKKNDNFVEALLLVFQDIISNNGQWSLAFWEHIQVSPLLQATNKITTKSNCSHFG